MKTPLPQSYLSHFKPPFKYDDYGNKILDSEDTLILDIRGFGRLRNALGDYRAYRAIDEFGRWLVEIMNQPNPTL